MYGGMFVCLTDSVIRKNNERLETEERISGKLVFLAFVTRVYSIFYKHFMYEYFIYLFTDCQ